MTSTMTNPISSGNTTRRLHHQTAISNTFEESFLLPTISSNPLITIVYTNSSLSNENQQIILNSYASCRRLLDHSKQIIGIHQDEIIDLMDNEGKVKELNAHFDDYASQFLTARSTYYVLKVEIDQISGEKRYTPYFNIEQIDQRLNSIITNSLNTLNKSVKSPVKRTATTTKQNSGGQSSAHSSQSRSKRSSARKQT